MSWDTLLDDKYVQQCDTIKEDYILCTKVGIPHRFDVDNDKDDMKIPLHVFCDASAKAY